MADDKTRYSLPLPPRIGLAGEFYDFCKRHELRFQRCSRCATWRHIPRHLCAKCGSGEWEWSKSSGRGKVFSWTTIMQPALPQFAKSVPYSAVVIEMDEGVRMVSWLVDTAPENLRLDHPVEVVFDDITEEVTLPKFKTVR
jgi:uncharacterized OB-fold protein